MLKTPVILKPHVASAPGQEDKTVFALSSSPKILASQMNGLLLMSKSQQIPDNRSAEAATTNQTIDTIVHEIPARLRGHGVTK